VLPNTAMKPSAAHVSREAVGPFGSLSSNSGMGPAAPAPGGASGHRAAADRRGLARVGPSHSFGPLPAFAGLGWRTMHQSPIPTSLERSGFSK